MSKSLFGTYSRTGTPARGVSKNFPDTQAGGVRRAQGASAGALRPGTGARGYPVRVPGAGRLGLLRTTTTPRQANTPPQKGLPLCESVDQGTDQVREPAAVGGGGEASEGVRPLPDFLPAR
jgi:hypothetical protein